MVITAIGTVTIALEWAILLGNMVDSEQNIENHVFPYILSQISSNEFEAVLNVIFDVSKPILSIIPLQITSFAGITIN